MKVLIDTNVIFDVLIKREPFYLNSAKVWTLSREEIIEAYIAAISITNLFYIVKKLKGQEAAEDFTDQLLNDFNVVELNKDIIKQARTLPGKDLEDLIQYFSALHQGCEVLITRNKKDFPTVGLSILTPTEFLQQI